MRVLLTVTLFLTSLQLAAHDLYLTANNRQVCAGIGEAFPASENAITADRLNAFRMHADGSTSDLTGKVVAKQFCAPAPSANGYVAEMTVQPRFIKLAGKDFA